MLWSVMSVMIDILGTDGFSGSTPNPTERTVHCIAVQLIDGIIRLLLTTICLAIVSKEFFF